MRRGIWASPSCPAVAAWDHFPRHRTCEPADAFEPIRDDVVVPPSNRAPVCICTLHMSQDFMPLEFRSDSLWCQMSRPFLSRRLCLESCLKRNLPRQLFLPQKIIRNMSSEDNGSTAPSKSKLICRYKEAVITP